MTALLLPLPTAQPAPGKAIAAATGNASDPTGLKAAAPELFAAALAAASPGANVSVPAAPATALAAGADPKARAKADAERGTETDPKGDASSTATLNPLAVGVVPALVVPFAGRGEASADQDPPGDVASEGRPMTVAGAASPAAAAPDGRPANVPAAASPSAGPLVAGSPAAPSHASAPTALAAPTPSTAGIPTPGPARPGRSPAPSAAPSGPADSVVPGARAPKTADPALAVVPSSSAVTPVPYPARAAAPDAPTPSSRQPFSAQLAKPVFTLAAAGPGEHVLTVKVTPEDLGPVTVQAHIAADGVKVELFAPTDAGRAAVQAALPELRRDLAASGLGASLDLSARSAPQDGGGAGGRNSPEGGGSGEAPGRGKRTPPTAGLDAARPISRASPGLPGTNARLDILA
ncbi:flagellar hook-length control protein FliK [Sinomonas susongensis]|uniref:flagellar hook-length control protein FliK n=1 Tax=Sinomonas susongensis TaxID=1324851 RepID=UPI0011098168|nr:flagellar hook-length control protein FliK [Sinomonas susongensis]